MSFACYRLLLCLPCSIYCEPTILAHFGERHVRVAGGKLAIVNLQKTPKDRRAALVLRARADHVMAALMAALNLQA